MSTTAPMNGTRLAGRIKTWHSKKGWGLIESEGRLYFARAQEIESESRDGQLFKWTIAAGMKVEFMATSGAAHPGPWLPATRIKVKP